MRERLRRVLEERVEASNVKKGEDSTEDMRVRKRESAVGKRGGDIKCFEKKHQLCFHDEPICRADLPHLRTRPCLNRKLLVPGLGPSSWGPNFEQNSIGVDELHP